MKIGLLQTGYIPDEIAEKHGDYPALYQKLLEEYDFDWETYPVVDEDFPSSIKECDGWFIGGSRHGAYEDLPWIKPLESFIREAYSQGIPLVGICFGHQIIAQALGGKVEKFNGGWGAGRQSYQRENSEIFVHAMHQDQVIEKPKTADTIVSSDFCQYAGFSYKNKALSYQPHPEFTTEFMVDLIKYRTGPTFSKDHSDALLGEINGDLDWQTLADEIAKFYKNTHVT